jgi:hypothetical protein
MGAGKTIPKCEKVRHYKDLPGGRKQLAATDACREAISRNLLPALIGLILVLVDPSRENQ